MTAWWVISLLLFVDGPVPVVRADDTPFHLGMVPTTFLPGGLEQGDQSFQQWIAPEVFDWYGHAGVVFLDRSMPHATIGQHLGAIQSQGAGSTIYDLNSGDNRYVSTRDLDMQPRAGLRFLVGRTIWADPCDDRGCVAKPQDVPEPMRSLSVELGYLGLIQQHQATARYQSQPSSPNGALISRLAGINGDGSYMPMLWPFDFANTNTLTYRSRFDSAELNLRYSTSTGRMPIDVLAGIRYFKLQENLDYQAANTISNLPGLLPASPYGNYSTRTDNDLIGLQIGSDLSYRLTSSLSLVGRGRGGLLVNSASQRNSLNGTMIASSLPLNESGTANGVGLAGLFEFGIHTNYQITSNMSLMLGYQGLYLSDLSTAPRQYLWNPELNGRNALDRNGSLFFFGPAAGIEWKW